MESVTTPCFNFKGISLSPEFGLHTQITELRCMGINSTCTIDFTQLAYMGSELKAHLCHLMVWQNLQCTFINWMHHGKPKVFCSFCNINHEHLEEGSVLINSHTNNTAQICHNPLQLCYHSSPHFSKPCLNMPHFHTNLPPH